MPGGLDQYKTQILDSLERQKAIATQEDTSAPSNLVQYLTAWTEVLGGEKGRGKIYIILDQFEEYFLYYPQETREETFSVEFPRAANAANSRVNFLISIREESLSKLSRFKGKILFLFDNILELKHLDRDSARAAIIKPLGEYNSHQLIADSLFAHRLTLLSGVSGAGKSRILKEGVIPHLNQLIQQQHPESHSFVEPTLVFFDSWHQDPTNELKKVIEATLQENFLDFQLTSKSNNLLKLLKVYSHYAKHSEGKHVLLIILDQFEEYALNSLRKETRDSEFIEQLYSAVETPDLPVNFLISIHRDFLNEIDCFVNHSSGFSKNCLRLISSSERGSLDAEYEHLSVEEKEAYLNTVLVPLQHYNGQPLMSERTISIESTLVEKVLDEVENALPSGNGIGGLDLKKKTKYCIEAPYLQVLMTRLWIEELDRGSHLLQLKTLIELGGAGKIFREHVENQMENLREDEQAAAVEFFQYMITPAGTKIAFPVLDLIPSKISLNASRLTSLLEKLSRGERRILRPAGPLPDRPDIQRYEIFHDVLAEPVLQWRRRYLRRQEISRKQQEIEAQRRQRIIAIERGLPAQALRQHRRGQYELSALLARQSFLFNQRDPCEVLDQVDEALREVLSIEDLGNLLRGHHAGVADVAFSTDSRFLASSSWDKTILLWDLHYPGQQPTVLKGHMGSVNAIAFSPDGHHLASGSDDRTVRIWDLSHLDAQPRILEGHKDVVKSIAFEPEGQWLASGSDDHGILLWNLHQLNQPPIALQEHEGKVNAVAFSPTCEFLVSGSEDTTVRLWDLKEWNKNSSSQITSRILPEGHRETVNSVAFSIDGALVASGSDDHTVRLWDLKQLDRAVAILEGHKEPVRAVAFSPERHTLASSGDDQTVRLWDLRRLSEPAQVLRGQFFVISSVAFSPDGQWLVSGSWDSSVRLQHLKPERAVPRQLREHSRFVRAVAMSSDGQFLASGGDDYRLNLWDLAQDDKPPLRLDHPREVWAVAFSHDGKVLATGCNDGIVRLWKHPYKLDTEPETLTAHVAPIRCVAFSPDSHWLASAHEDTTILLWNLLDKEEPPQTLADPTGRSYNHRWLKPESDHQG
jgi:WD40 repeat protein